MNLKERRGDEPKHAFSFVNYPAMKVVDGVCAPIFVLMDEATEMTTGSEARVVRFNVAELWSK